MTLERQLAEHSERIAQVADADLARALAADLPVLAALVDGDYAAERVLSIVFAHLAVLLEHTARLAAARPSDAVIVQTVRELGVRPAARALKMSKSAVSRIARSAVPTGTPVSLPTVEPGCTVAPVEFDVMEPGDAVVASLVHNHGVPTARHDTGDDPKMFGTKRGPELISPQAALPALFERVGRLERLTAEAEKQEAEQLQVRQRLAEEMVALTEALAREGARLHKAIQKALHELDFAAGPSARAKADEALRALILQQQSNSIAQELQPAKLAKELRRTADPAWREAQAHFEREMEGNHAFNPPFIADGRRFTADQDVREALIYRSRVLKAAHRYCRDEGPLLPLSREQVLQEIDRLNARVPPIPPSASLAFMPLEGVPSNPAPTAVPDGVVYRDGVRQR